MHAEASILIEYQAPYSPDLNPIEYLFGSIKNHIRKRSREDEDLIQGDFKSYLQMQVRLVGRDKKIARGHGENRTFFVTPEFADGEAEPGGGDKMDVDSSRSDLRVI